MDARQIYWATPKGLRWAKLLEELFISHDTIIKSPSHPQGRLLIAAFWQRQKYFTAMELDAATESVPGSLQEALKNNHVFFTVAEKGTVNPVYSLTYCGLRNATILERVWREMSAMLTDPKSVESTPMGSAAGSSPARPHSPQPTFHEPLIRARGLTRKFRQMGRKGDTVQAVQGVDITVARGELVGFLGPNGAGKTTTLRMLTTLLRPTAGEATIAGCDLLKEPRAIRRRIGYVAQGNGSSPESTVAEELLIQARLHSLTKSIARALNAELLRQPDLLGLEKRLTRTLSGGQKRRLDIALGIVHTPEIISSMNLPPAWILRAGPICGPTSVNCGLRRA
ncbi:ATP-binding cassette domain-containing protein [Streptomyces flaveolus]|uniref:ATP-binding cassette domain-containing protein n=1 Tax=Streptomyces flaveolus TaxID=67297 RepID=UPI0033C5B970